MSDGFILANIKKGHYVLIEPSEEKNGWPGDKVVADIQRKFRPAPVGKGWWLDGYILRWRHNMESVELFKTLAEVHELYYIVNFPGYGHVLR